jgi:stage II sporulation protein D
MPSSAGGTYDVYGTVADQEYHGVSGEAPAATQAVHDTAGQLLVYDGAPVDAMYCSDAGGCTAPGKFPYLQPVYSYSPDSKWNGWQAQLSLEQLTKFAAQDNQDVGQPQSVRTENDAVTGHLLALSLVGSKGQWRIGGKALRKRVGLSTMRSTRAWLFPAAAPGDPPPPPQFARDGTPLKCYAPAGTTAAAGREAAAVDIDAGDSNPDVPGGADGPPAASGGSAAVLVQEISAAQAKGGLVLVGSGNGHGVGLSQYGAATLARQGWTYRQILLYFYRGVQFAQLPARFMQPSLPQQYCTDDNDVAVH